MKLIHTNNFYSSAFSYAQNLLSRAAVMHAIWFGSYHEPNNIIVRDLDTGQEVSVEIVINAGVVDNVTGQICINNKLLDKGHACFRSFKNSMKHGKPGTNNNLFFYHYGYIPERLCQLPNGNYLLLDFKRNYVGVFDSNTALKKNIALYEWCNILPDMVDINTCGLVVYEHTLIIRNAVNNNLISLNLLNGSVNWQHSFQESIYHPYYGGVLPRLFVSEDKKYKFLLCTNSNSMQVIDFSTGEVKLNVILTKQETYSVQYESGWAPVIATLTELPNHLLAITYNKIYYDYSIHSNNLLLDFTD